MSDFSHVKIALISDNLTEKSLESECRVKALTPSNFKRVIKFWKPDLVLVESCWMGRKNRWRYQIASYPEHAKRNNNTLKLLVEFARDRDIPTVFWNKEDGVHFERFIDSAKHFDYIFTTDSNMIPSYKEQCLHVKSVSALPFAVNPAIHFPQEIDRLPKFCFAGSYRVDAHEGRRFNQEIVLEPALEYGLDIFDRNSDRKSHIFRFPDAYAAHVKPQVKYKHTGKLYNRYLGCLNVNTIVDSPTMFSRRVVEVLACKRPLVTTNSQAIEHYFKDSAFVTESEEQTKEHLDLIYRYPNDPAVLTKLQAGYELVMEQFTYHHWLEKIMNKIG